MKNVKKLIKYNSVLTNLAQSITEHQQLLNFVQSLLPKSIAPHCIAAVRNGTRLTLFVDSPAWSSRIRYLTAELLRSLNNHTPKIVHIKVRIIPPSGNLKANQPKRHPSRPSLEEVEQIENTADFVEDPELSAALHRLAQHVKKRD